MIYPTAAHGWHRVLERKTAVTRDLISRRFEAAVRGLSPVGVAREVGVRTTFGRFSHVLPTSLRSWSGVEADGQPRDLHLGVRPFGTVQGVEHGDRQVAKAWDELRQHPALQWTPPMWRSMPAPRVGGAEVGLNSHVISAVDRNLLIEIRTLEGDQFAVRLATGPLQDRRVAGGVDPTTPAASLDPALDVVAPTFEEALVELRDAVVTRFGVACESTGSASARQVN